MFPDLQIFGRTVTSYAISIIIGFVFALLFIIYSSKKNKIDPETSVIIFVFSCVGALTGAKLLYLLVNIKGIIADIYLITENFELFVAKYLQGGLVFYGGIFGAISVAAITAHFYKEKLRDYYPALLPAMAVFCGAGRIGCFSVGCCYGAQTTLPIHVTYSISKYAPNGVNLLPTQLFEAIFDFILAFVIYKLCKKEKLRYYMLEFYLICYGVFRFILEFFRGDAVRGIYLGFSTSQWISIVVLIVCVTAVVLKKSKNKAVS